MSNRNAYTGPRYPERPRRPTHLFTWGYRIGRVLGFIRSLFGRKRAPALGRAAPRPHNPNRWVWWFFGTCLVLIFWQPLLILVIVLAALLGAH